MPPIPHRPTLNMKLGLMQLFRWKRNESMSSDRRPPPRPHIVAAKGINLEALETMMARRMRLILRHTWLVVTFAVLLLAGLIALSVYMLEQQTVLRVAVGPRDSADVRIVEILADKFAREHASIKLVPVIQNEPVNAKDISGKPDFDLAIIRSNLVIDARWPVVAIVRQNVAVLMVPAPGTRDPKKVDAKKAKLAKIEKVPDLAGRRVGIVGESEASPDLLHDILRQYDVPIDKVELLEVAPKDLQNAVHDNRIDAILVAGPVTGKAIADAVAAASNGKQAPTFIAIDQAEAIAQRLTAYEKFSIVAGSFGGSPAKPAEDMDSLNFPQYIVARRTLDEGQIANFSKLLYTSRQALAHDLPGVVKIEKPSTDKDSAVLVHPGAETYLGDNQKSFFEKYGDGIFYGLLILPFFGSGLAALAGYLRADDSTRRIRLLHRLLTITKKARCAETLELVDELQAECDDVVTETIHQAERDKLDDTAMAIFNLAINQSRLAISDRRAALLLRPLGEAAPRPAPQPISTPRQAASGP
jgi:TRAP-type uncharacterized transport system substrate-binding protein